MSNELLHEWLEIADEDWRAARALQADQAPRVICFLCQQCIEKYLNAALVKWDAPVRKTHDIVVLTEMLAEKDERFTALGDECEPLNEYAVESRYPGAELSASEAQEALQKTRVLRQKMRALLDPEDHQ